jgi:hypothetical protein
MTLEAMLRLIAGAFVTASVGLGVFVSPYFFLFTAFVGLNLVHTAAPKSFVFGRTISLLITPVPTRHTRANTSWLI